MQFLDGFFVVRDGRVAPAGLLADGRLADSGCTATIPEIKKYSFRKWLGTVWNALERLEREICDE
jgi:hypothetical protein